MEAAGIEAVPMEGAAAVDVGQSPDDAGQSAPNVGQGNEKDQADPLRHASTSDTGGQPDAATGRKLRPTGGQQDRGLQFLISVWSQLPASLRAYVLELVEREVVGEG